MDTAHHAHSVAEHTDMMSNVIPAMRPGDHDIMEAIEGFHLREYQRIFMERIAEAAGDLPPILFNSTLTYRPFIEAMRHHEEAWITALYADHKPIVLDFETNPLRSAELLGHRADHVVIDDFHFATMPAAPIDEYLSAAPPRPTPKIEVPANYVPPTTTNRAARRRQAKKDRRRV